MLALAIALAGLTAAAVAANVALLGLGIGSDHPVGTLGPSIAKLHPAGTTPTPPAGGSSTPRKAPAAMATLAPAASPAKPRAAPAGAALGATRDAKTTPAEGLDDDD